MVAFTLQQLSATVSDLLHLSQRRLEHHQTTGIRPTHRITKSRIQPTHLHHQELPALSLSGLLAPSLPDSVIRLSPEASPQVKPLSHITTDYYLQEHYHGGAKASSGVPQRGISLARLKRADQLVQVVAEQLSGIEGEQLDAPGVQQQQQADDVREQRGGLPRRASGGRPRSASAASHLPSTARSAGVQAGVQLARSGPAASCRGTGRSRDRGRARLSR